MAIAGLFFWGFLRVYLRAAQDLTRLECVARSPIYSHVVSSLAGLTTIRSCRIEKLLCKEFDDLLDMHSSCWYLTLSGNALLGFWLDIISVAFISCVIFSFILMEDPTTLFSGNVGLAISQAMSLTAVIQYGVRQYLNSISNMTSVERVLQYTDVEQEEDFKDHYLPSSWPTNGQIEFKNVKLFYSPTAQPILKGVSFLIKSGWKVGIVGRTGAGKSSIITALFRLYPIEGSILIDDLKTNEIHLPSHRSKLSIIPQNPDLFSATVRYNLDPFQKHEDSELWAALEDVEMKNVVESLDFIVSEGGKNFSVGQRQLICLARAILRNNKILVLDEATASIDPQTDIIIQNTIRNKFHYCTVLTIAHRLHTVLDSDRILVVDNGLVKEFGSPFELLQVSNGYFASMAKQARLSPRTLHIATKKYIENK